MPTTLFDRPRSIVLAAALSLVALASMAFYVAAPSVTPSFAAEYIAVSAKAKKPAGGVVGGVVRNARNGAVRTARVTVTYVHGGKTHKVTAKVDRNGGFKVVLPRGVKTAGVSILERPGGRKTTGTVTIKAGKNVSVTAVFPPRGTGILPGLFPY